MQPENPQPQLGPERTPVERNFSAESLPKLPIPEKSSLETGADRREQVAESQAAVADASIATPAVVTPTIPVVADDRPQASIATNAPLAAADSDLIEKEWVDRAKKIVEETHSDPAKREQRVNALHKDYLYKRYGKELGATD